MGIILSLQTSIRSREMDKPKRHRWTAAEVQLLTDNLGKKTYKEIGALLGKTELAIHLYVHRKKLQVRPVVKRNLVIELFRIRLINPDHFTVTSAFLRASRITSIRFWKLYRGETVPTNDEYMRLAETLGVTLTEAFEARQLSIFDELEETE